MTVRHLWIAVILTVAACGAEPSQVDTGEPPIGKIPSVRSAADITLPLDTYSQTPDRQRAVHTAVTILGRECMKQLGLEWPSPATTGNANANANGASGDRHARRYAIIDAGKAAVDGYHATGSPRARQAAQGQPEAPSADAMNVWVGRGPATYNGRPVPAGGCAGEAARRLAGGVKSADIALPQQLQMDSFSRTRADSRVVKAFGAWSKCMKESGYDYADPFAAAGDQRWQTQETGSQEIATAVADVACKVKVELAGIMLAVERAYQARLIEQRSTDLDAVGAYLEAEAVAAARVVSGGAPR